MTLPMQIAHLKLPSLAAHSYRPVNFIEFFILSLSLLLLVNYIFAKQLHNACVSRRYICNTPLPLPRRFFSSECWNTAKMREFRENDTFPRDLSPSPPFLLWASACRLNVQSQSKLLAKSTLCCLGNIYWTV